MLNRTRNLARHRADADGATAAGPADHPQPPTATHPRAPGWVRLGLEARAPLELWASLLAWPLWAAAPRGDGHPVLVLPGFMASDLSTAPLRQWLQLLGHDAHGWGQGRNLGPWRGTLDAVLAQVQALHQREGRSVSLLGWSLGGLYARELAKRAPQAVRSVITLGTPFAGGPQSTNAGRLYELVRQRHGQARGARPAAPHERQPPEALRQAPPVPTTSIYSRSDGVVAWQGSVQAAGEAGRAAPAEALPADASQAGLVENIEVEASHSGLGVNPWVLHVLADRLAQPEGQWRPFERTGLRRLAYPDPQRPAAWWDRTEPRR